MAKESRGKQSEQLAVVSTASTWEDLVGLENFFGAKGKWVFRGHRAENWELESTLERAMRRFNIGQSTPSKLEGGLVRQFSRRAHHFISDAPREEEWVEWLALMQHHGAPTRLLDFTYSFYVGLFFALEDMELGSESALWAVNVDWLDGRLTKIVGANLFKTFTERDRNVRKIKTFRGLLGSGRRMAFFLNPYRLNQRLSIQQGIFLCPGDVSSSLVKNLEALGSAGDMIRKIKINLDQSEYRRCIRKLIRMNMTRTSLFPGLDGFAMSQKMALANTHILVGDWKYPTR